MKIRLVLLLFVVLNFSASGKSLKGFFTSKKDSNYIASYFNDLIIRIYSGEKTHSLQLNDLNSKYRLQYLPNGYFNIGIGLNFRSFGLSLATKIPFLQNNDYKNGETKRFGLQSYIYLSKFSIDLFASYSKGYYLNNSFQHLKYYSKDLEYQRPDMVSSNIGVSVNYIFNNKKFSYKAAFGDTEKQKRSAGSFISGGSILSYRTRGDSAFIPVGIDKTLFLKSRDIKESGVLAFNANGGYAYSLVFLRNGIVSLSYILGAGIQDNKYDRKSKSSINNWRLSFNNSGRLGIGYRFKGYYARVAVIRSTEYTNLKYNDLGIVNGTDFVQFSLGRRLSIK